MIVDNVCSFKMRLLLSDPEWTSDKQELDEQDEGYALHLKGQMMYMSQWQSIIFLGTPM